MGRTESTEHFLECEEHNQDSEITGQNGDQEKQECPWEIIAEPLTPSKVENDNSEYVIHDQEKTTFLYSDTLELYMCHTGETVKIQKQQIEVGREKGCDLRLENLYVARRQATFFYENQSWFFTR